MALQNHSQIPNQTSPYSLDFEGETTLSTTPIIKGAIYAKMTNKRKANLHLIELETINKERLIAQQNLELYQQWMSTVFNKCPIPIILKR